MKSIGLVADWVLERNRLAISRRVWAVIGNSKQWNFTICRFGLLTAAGCTAVGDLLDLAYGQGISPN